MTVRCSIGSWKDEVADFNTSCRSSESEVSSKRITLTAEVSDGDLVVTWEDDGVGVSGEDKKRLFERGFGKHTGLGLFLSREILGLTGITITENGIPGSGARFVVRVPAGKWRDLE